MRSDKLNNGVETNSSDMISPKMIARVTAKLSLFQHGSGCGSRFGSVPNAKRPSTTVAVNDSSVVTCGKTRLQIPRLGNQFSLMSLQQRRVGKSK